MSTRSVIGITDRDGNGQLIFCFFDGYPDGVGLTLLQHWQDEPKVRELMALGDLSILNSEIGHQVDFNSFHTNIEARGIQCLAYGRDGEERNIDAISFAGGYQGFFDYAKEQHTDCEYGYLWTADGWFGSKLSHDWRYNRVPQAARPRLESLGSMVKASMDERNERLIREGREPITMPKELANVA